MNAVDAATRIVGVAGNGLCGETVFDLVNTDA